MGADSEHVGVRQQRPQESDIRLHAGDAEFAERPRRPRRRGRKIGGRRIGDDLRQQRIETPGSSGSRHSRKYRFECADRTNFETPSKGRSKDAPPRSAPSSPMFTRA